MEGLLNGRSAPLLFLQVSPHVGKEKNLLKSWRQVLLPVGSPSGLNVLRALVKIPGSGFHVRKWPKNIRKQIILPQTTDDFLTAVEFPLVKLEDVLFSNEFPITRKSAMYFSSNC